MAEIKQQRDGEDFAKLFENTASNVCRTCMTVYRNIGIKTKNRLAKEKRTSRAFCQIKRKEGDGRNTQDNPHQHQSGQTFTRRHSLQRRWTHGRRAPSPQARGGGNLGVAAGVVVRSGSMSFVCSPPVAKLHACFRSLFSCR